MKKILVIGSLGYVGSVLTPYLERCGYETIGYDTGFFKDCVLGEVPTTKAVILDARDFKEELLDGVYAVVHLAGISNDPFGNIDAKKIYEPTRVYARQIAELCKKRGVKFIFSSSCSIYGRGEGVLDEESPVAPQTPYSLNKLQVEEDLRALADQSFSPIALRFATAFGYSPRMRFDIVVNMFVGMALTSGKIVLNSDGIAWRPNVHILDMCSAIKYALESGYAEPHALVLNVGDESNNHRIIDMAHMVSEAVPGTQVEFLANRPDLDPTGLIKDKKVSGADTRTYQVSFEKIKHAFPGFVCEWSLERGIADMVEKFKEVGLTKELFQSKDFYRLQKIESLHATGQISDDLRWINSAT